MKSDRRSIMRAAWAIRRKSNCTMSKALKTAWAAVKALAEAVVSLKSFGISRGCTSIWEKYGKCRCYLTAKAYTGVNSDAVGLKREIKVGYIDMMAAEFVAA